MTDELDRDEQRLAGLFAEVHASASMRRWERVATDASGGERTRRRWSPLRLVAPAGPLQLRPLALALVVPVVVAAVGGSLGLRAHFAGTGSGGESPSPRAEAAMAWDPEHHVVVLFGGRRGTDWFDDTWTWDGSAWTERHPEVSPSARSGAGMAYDPKSGRVLLFGGTAAIPAGSGSGGDPASDTWSWDGSSWRQEHPAHRPSASGPFGLFSTAMATDEARGEVVLVGFTRGTPASDTQDSAVPRHTLEPLPGGSGGVSGGDGFTSVSGSITQDGSAPAGSRTPAPTPVDALPGATSPQGAPSGLASGLAPNGLGESGTIGTWTWTGSDWRVRQTRTVPSGLLGPISLAYDAQHHDVVLPLADPVARGSCPVPAGGPQMTAQPHPTPEPAVACEAPMPATRTWSWNGSTWHASDGVTIMGMPVRLATDPSGTVLAFKGLSTWEWTGAYWDLQTRGENPGYRLGPALAPDMDRHTVVLFGGYLYRSYAGDTATWDGRTWTTRSGERFIPPAAPPAPTAPPGCTRNNPAVIDQSSGPGGTVLVTVTVRPACVTRVPARLVIELRGPDGQPLRVMGNPQRFAGTQATVRWSNWCPRAQAVNVAAVVNVAVVVNGDGVEQTARLPACTDFGGDSSLTPGAF